MIFCILRSFDFILITSACSFLETSVCIFSTFCYCCPLVMIVRIGYNLTIVIIIGTLFSCRRIQDWEQIHQFYDLEQVILPHCALASIELGWKYVAKSMMYDWQHGMNEKMWLLKSVCTVCINKNCTGLLWALTLPVKIEMQFVYYPELNVCTRKCWCHIYFECRWYNWKLRDKNKMVLPWFGDFIKFVLVGCLRYVIH